MRGKMLAEVKSTSSLPLVTPGLVLTDVVCANQAAVIQRGLKLLVEQGRADDALALEQSLWQREAVGSTACEFGFAIPHCKSMSVRANSLVVLKLRQPVAWGAIDPQPVGFVILIVLREAAKVGRHLGILSRLSRNIMDDHFREQLIKEADAATLCAMLERPLSQETVIGPEANPVRSASRS